MIIYVQFFPEYKETATSPISEKEGSLGIFQVEYDPSYQDVVLEEGEVVIIDIADIPSEPPETQEEKHSRVKSMIITGDMENIDLEGELFSDFEIGEIITARVFGGNPHAEKAITNKVLAVTLALLQGVEMTEDMSRKIAEATAKKAEVDVVRNLFNLGNL